MTFHQIISLGDNLHEMSKLIFLEKLEKKKSECCLQKYLLSVLKVNG